MYKLLLIPSSDDEGQFSTEETFEQALRKAKRKKCAFKLLSFKTEPELLAAIAGYEAGVGYMGEGLWFRGKSIPKR